jgi:hypothetical protein
MQAISHSKPTLERSPLAQRITWSPRQKWRLRWLAGQQGSRVFVWTHIQGHTQPAQHKRDRCLAGNQGFQLIRPCRVQLYKIN